MSDYPNHTEAPRRPLDDISPYGSNPKTHPDEQIEKIASSIRRFGWNQPIVVDGDGVIIVGHGRRLAAKRLGEETVPVVERSDMSEAEARAYRLADNKTGESGWDMDLLGVELELLDNSETPLEATAFSDAEANGIIDSQDIDIDELFEEPDPSSESSDDLGGQESNDWVECPECGYEFEHIE